MPDEGRRDLLGLRSGGEGMITGTVVCAAAIAYTASTSDSVWDISAKIVGTVVVYWVAHLHAITIGSALTNRHHPFKAIRHGLRETWPILAASVLPVAILLVTALLGAELRTSAWVALIGTIVLLTAYSYVAGRRGGLDTWGCLAAATAGAGVGLLVILLKVGLH